MKPKAIAKYVAGQLKRIGTSQTQEEYQLSSALQYIHEYWAKLENENHNDDGSLIGLPNKYIVPSAKEGNFSFGEQYYWDSFFISIGITGKEDELIVEGMLDNILVLLERFDLVPNASRMYFTSRSQAPLLTTYIFHVYDTYTRSEDWLKKRIAAAKKEYETVWMGDQHPHWRNVHDGLSRYYDINGLHDLAEAESGWDMTPRFKRQCLDFLPIDLNCMLYKYEMDFSRAATILDNKREAAKWRRAADKRKKAIDKVMWAKQRGFYFDYNYQTDSKSNIWSLAAYLSLWSGMATEEQARRLADNITRFEQKGGLTTTAKPLIDTNTFGSIVAQWAYPNGWAPLHYFVIEGLERYGYYDEAEILAKKWIKTNLKWFVKHNEFCEKYNVVNLNKAPVEGLYPNQKGFGWTNGVFVYLAHKYFDVSSEADLDKQLKD